MFFINFPKNLIAGIILVSLFAGCSTQLEERASMDFEPPMPGNQKGQKNVIQHLYYQPDLHCFLNN